MVRLVFVPPAAGGPHLFLWQEEGDTDAVRHAMEKELADAGQPAMASVVTATGEAAPVSGVTIALAQALPVLAALPADDIAQVPASVAAWSLAAKLALDLIARERLVPRVLAVDGGAAAGWGVSLTMADDGERFRRLAAALPRAAHAAAGKDGAPWPADEVLLEFLDTVADLLVHVGPPADPDAPAPTPQRAERWERKLARALTEPGSDRVFLSAGVLERGLIDQLVQWAARPRGSVASRAPRLCLKLDPPAETTGDGNRAVWTLGYFLQAADDPSLLLPAREIWTSAGERLEWMDRGLDEPQELLLRELARAGRIFRPIEASLDRRSPDAVKVDTPGAWKFLSEAVPVFAEAGVGVVLPAELSPDGQRRLRLRMRVGGTSKGAAGVVSGAGRGFSLDELTAYRWEAAIGDRPLTTAEFQQLVALKRPLVEWRGQWVVLDPAEAAEMRRLLVDGGGRVAAREALTAALTETFEIEGHRPAVSVVAEGRLAAMLDELRAGASPYPPPHDLVGELRPYQGRGVGWMGAIAAHRLGGCLADDMGLGKTIQAIGFLLARRQADRHDRRPSLIVCPTSVVGNWERELQRFAPTLPVVRHHGAGRPRTPEALMATPHAVVVTTYGMLRRDRALLGKVDWAVAILDEAQNIKNASSQQAASARGLRATDRFALTGTPVENRLAELWSIMEFCVPGFLGPLELFRRKYAVPIERYRDAEAAERLRRLVRPFVMRRRKGDPAIALDLPPKQEMAVVCTLTREQATLYQAAVDDAMAKIERTDSHSIERKGLILALITALKQICNHPAHYLRQKGPLGGRSGKLARVTEMLEESVVSGDRALVFTQFREMGDRLVRHLTATLGGDVLFLHGGVPRAARDEMVRRFQEDPRAPAIFVLSLRAGGTGLNLTRATRVFHFDRWWNPAVEDQATDRTHRIGQERMVQVYRLLSAGTIEEKIDQMLVDKRALADRIVSDGEAWITELDDDALRSLVTLAGDATVEEELD
jgi:SNF2 domain-containing protein/SNF2 helicase protein/helicase-like protein